MKPVDVRITLPIRRAAATIACALVGLGALSACAAAKSKPTLNIGISNPGSSLNPATNGSGGAFLVSSLSNEPLIHQLPNGSYGPGLAESWKYLNTKTSRNKVFQLKLQPHVRFSNGQVVTAQAVKEWFTYFYGANGPYAHALGVAKFLAIGKWTVRIVLQTPNPIMPYELSEYSNWSYVTAPSCVAKPAMLSTQTCGAGAYVVSPSQSVTGDHYTFVPNKHYFDPAAVKWGKIVVKIIAAPSTMLQALKDGQLDVAMGDPTTAGSVGGSASIVSVPSTFDMIDFPDLSGTIAKPLASAKVRQAMNYAINRAQIARALYGKYGSPTSTVMPWGYDTKYRNYYSYNPAKARALLAQAGYPHGFSLPFLTSANFSTATQALAGDLQAVGITLNITTSTPQQYFANFGSGKYPAFFLPYTAATTWEFYATTLRPGALLNQHGFNDPVLNKIMARGAVSGDPAPYWARFTKRATIQGYFLPFVISDQIWYVSKKVAGFTLTPTMYTALPMEWSPR